MEGSNNDGEHVIKDNDKFCGKNCLIFIQHAEPKRVWYKFYNKFVQSI